MNLFRKKTKPEERRAHLRNRIAGNDFEATLKREDGGHLPIAILEISAGGAKVRTNPGGTENIETGEEVVLELVVSYPGRLIQLAATVMRVDDNCVTMAITEENLDEIPLDVESRMLLSRRKYPRHKIAEHVAIDLTIASVVVTGTLHDISEGGLGMTLTKDHAGTLKLDDEVDVEFQLPGRHAISDIHARVCHRTPFDGDVLFGLAFDFDRGDQVNPIEEYLAQLSK
ncbi:MAG: c-di-GMP-binding flagellar brake protein YcgR [Planctomycetota bacterium]|jgi:c-di-GMP-binding flagellar brake protein YcgR